MPAQAGIREVVSPIEQGMDYMSPRQWVATAQPLQREGAPSRRWPRSSARVSDQANVRW